MAQDEDLTVLCLQDTRLLPHKEIPNKSRLTIPGFDVYHTPKTDNHHGILTASKRTIPSTDVTQRYNFGPNCESLSIIIHLQDKDITIHNIYRTKGNITLINAMDPNNPAIICGDFNAHHPMWDSGHRSDPAGTSIYNELWNSAEYALMNNPGPTHSSGSTIDLTILHTSLIPEAQWDLHETLLSDHNGIRLTVGSEPPQQTNPNNQRWVLHKADWLRFRRELLTVEPLQPITDKTELNNASNEITVAILLAAAESIPTSKGKGKKHDQWYTNSLVKLAKRLLNRANRTHSANKTDRNKANLDYHLTLFQDTVKEAKTESWRKWLAALHHQPTTKELWKRINIVQGREPPPPKHPDPITKANEINDRFIARSASSNLNPGTANHLTQTHDQRWARINNAINTDHPADCPFTMEELEAALALKKDSAPGEDTITFSMIKNTPPLFKQRILQLINASWTLQTLPYSWKCARIVPIPKPKQQDTFRPISLLPTLGKTMETMVRARLEWSTPPRHPHLFGYRARRSTTDAITTVINKITTAARNKRSAALFLDIEKAYEMANRSAILDIMAKEGIKGKLLGWISHFLLNRKGSTSFQGHQSSIRTFENGTPQGSVLSPAIFNYLINEIISTPLPQGTTAIAYADDLAIIATNQQPDCLLQDAATIIHRRTTELGLQLAPQKTEAIYFGRFPIIQIQLGATSVPWSKQVKYLGVTIDSQLTFKQHIEVSVSKTAKRMNGMKVLSSKPEGATSKIMGQILKAAVIPIMDYGAPILLLASKSNMDRLHKAQNAAIQLTYGLYKWTNVNASHILADILPPTTRHKGITFKYVDKLARDPTHPFHPAIVKNLITQHRKPPQRNKNWVRRATNIVKSISPGYQIPPLLVRPPWPPWKKSWISSEKLSLRTSKKDLSPDQVKVMATNHINSITEPNDLTIYTDGLITGEGRAGAACILPDHSIRTRIHGPVSSTQTELIAINLALQNVSTPPRGKILIHTDSISTIQAIASRAPNINSNLTTSIHHEAERLRCPITLNWTPSHVGVEGNEEADVAAKSATTITAPATTLSHTTSSRTKRIWKTLWEDWLSEIPQTTSLTWIMELNIREKALTAVALLERASQRQIYKLITHSLSYAQIVERIKTCPHCDMDIISYPVHYIVICPAKIRHIEKLKNHINPDEHSLQPRDMAIAIIRSQAERQFKELEQYVQQVPPYSR